MHLGAGTNNNHVFSLHVLVRYTDPQSQNISVWLHREREGGEGREGRGGREGGREGREGKGREGKGGEGRGGEGGKGREGEGIEKWREGGRESERDRPKARIRTRIHSPHPYDVGDVLDRKVLPSVKLLVRVHKSEAAPRHLKLHQVSSAARVGLW